MVRFTVFLSALLSVFSSNAQSCLRDTIPPAVTCINSLSLNIIGVGSTTLWASDVLNDATDNCTPSIELNYAISKTNNVVFPADAAGHPIGSVSFDCLEFGPNSVRIWAKDKAGNIGFCTAIVQVKDVFCNCDCSMGTFSGKITTEKGE